MTGEKTCSSIGCIKSKKGNVHNKEILQRWNVNTYETSSRTTEEQNLQSLKIEGPVVFKSDVWSLLANMKRNQATGSDGNFNRYCHPYMIEINKITEIITIVKSKCLWCNSAKIEVTLWST